jgi:hypothetical protein
MGVYFLDNYMMRGVNPELAENEIAVAVGEAEDEPAVNGGGGAAGGGGGAATGIEGGVGDGGAAAAASGGAAPAPVRDSVLAASKADSDLVKGVYEGGMKVWECTHDLVNYCIAVEVEFTGLRVLELGCGAGFPGIYAWREGGQVDFQDYNVEVLEHITMPNVALNDSPSPTEEVRAATAAAVAPNPKRRKTRTSARATRSAANAAAAVAATPPTLEHRPRFFGGGWASFTCSVCCFWFRCGCLRMWWQANDLLLSRST